MPDRRDLGLRTAWSTTFYQRDWPGHAAAAPSLIARLRECRDRDATAIASGVATAVKSNLYESNFDLFDDPSLGELVAFIDETVRACVAHINGGHVPPDQLCVKFLDSWCHITRDGGFHDAHTHPGCSWCGIYYVQLGDAAHSAEGMAPNGGSRFYSPLPNGGMTSDYGNHYRNVSSLDAPVRDGRLVLFPSYLLHSGLPYRGTQERIVIAFNATIQTIFTRNHQSNVADS